MRVESDGIDRGVLGLRRAGRVGICSGGGAGCGGADQDEVADDRDGVCAAVVRERVVVILVVDNRVCLRIDHVQAGVGVLVDSGY